VLDDYTPVAILIFFSVAFAAVVLGLARFISSLNRPGAKLTTYECGVRPTGDARDPVPINFYVVAMLFILFDIEATFLYPWAVVFKRLGVFGLIEMMVFLGVLVAGLVYVWRRGVLEWRA
jgi:NADH-quinone oxidoreductase subunit A